MLLVYSGLTRNAKLGGVLKKHAKLGGVLQTIKQMGGGGYSATNNTTNTMGSRVRHPEKPLTSNKGEAATNAATEVI